MTLLAYFDILVLDKTVMKSLRKAFYLKYTNVKFVLFALQCTLKNFLLLAAPTVMQKLQNMLAYHHIYRRSRLIFIVNSLSLV